MLVCLAVVLIGVKHTNSHASSINGWSIRIVGECAKTAAVQKPKPIASYTRQRVGSASGHSN